MGNKQNKLNNRDEIRELALDGKENDDNHTNALKNMTDFISLFALERSDECALTTKMAQKVEQASAESYGRLGMRLFKLGKVTESEKALQQAIELDPKCAVYSRDLSIAVA